MGFRHRAFQNGAGITVKSRRSQLHLLANQSDIHFWLGVAVELLRPKKSAQHHWRTATMFRGDFQEMAVRAFSEMTFYSALSLEKLNRKVRAKKLFRELLAYALTLQKKKAKIEYFATSLPTMLLFEDDLQCRQETTALFLQAQAWFGLGSKSRAKRLLLQGFDGAIQTTRSQQISASLSI